MYRAFAKRQGAEGGSAELLGPDEPGRDVVDVVQAVEGADDAETIGVKPFDPSLDNIAGQKVEGGDVLGTDQCPKAGVRRGLVGQPDPLPGIFLELANRDIKLDGRHQVDLFETTTIELARHGKDMLRAHACRPQALVRIPQGRVDDFDLAPAVGRPAAHAHDAGDRLSVFCGHLIGLQPLFFPSLSTHRAQPSRSLEELCQRQSISVVYVTTRGQNPTNATLPLHRREQIAEIARRHDLPIIESDIYGTTMADPLPPIFSIAPERTHFLTSFGRIVGPGIKVGCLVSPLADVATTQAGVGMSTGSATLIAAEIVSRWVTGNQLEGMIRWQQAENIRRLSLLTTYPLLGNARTDITSPHVWLPLPEQWRAGGFRGCGSSAAYHDRANA